MKFHLQRASDLTLEDIDIIEINNINELKELPTKYKAHNDIAYDTNAIVVDFDKSYFKDEDNTDGTITIYDYYIE